MKQYKYLVHFIFGRANFGLIQTDVDVVEGTGEYAGSYLVFKRDENVAETHIVSSDEEPIPYTVMAVDEVEFMVGDDLEKMIQIYNKNSVDLYQEDLMSYFEQMKLNLNKEVDVSE